MMKPARLIAPAVAIAMAAFITGQAQTEKTTIAADQSTTEKAPVQIVSHKIGLDYYPMLDRPSMTVPSMTAETGDLPPTENEQLARQQRARGNRTVANPNAREETRSRGRLLSYTRVIDNAQMVQVVIKNTESRPIKTVDWDFAFPRYENGQLLSRYDVTTSIEIKPGGKKALKYKLPPGAKRCEVVKVISGENQPEKTVTFEAVCGQGFHDPSLLNQKQETISIIRIEYANGDIWQRP